MKYCYFYEIPIGKIFRCNGNVCKKTSSRTALLVEYGKAFYFLKKELCSTG